MVDYASSKSLEKSSEVSLSKHSKDFNAVDNSRDSITIYHFCLYYRT